MLLMLLIVSVNSINLAYCSPRKVVIDNFPPGVGESASEEFLGPYLPLLQFIVCTVEESDSLGVVFTSSVDTTQYGEHHDGSNGGLAVDRLIILKEILIDMGLSEDKIVSESYFIKSDTGGQYRYAAVEIVLFPRQGDKTTTVIEHTTQNFFTQYFGGVTFGVSTVPDASVVFLIGTRLQLTDRMYVGGQIGHSLFQNKQTVEDGNQADAFALYYNGSLAYRIHEWTAVRNSVTDTLSMLNFLIGVTRIENNTVDEFDYLRIRRLFEIGIEYQHSWWALRFMVGYGFDDLWDHTTVDYGMFARLQAIAIVVGR